MSLRVLLLNWRDQHHPEAGGAEKYLVTVAEGLAARDHRVTFQTAGYPGAVPEEVVNGVRYVRKGGHYSVYPRAFLGRQHAAHDVVVDVQNGVPFLSPLVTRVPVVNLVHHVHREQWPVVFGPRAARVGWWMESSVAPRIYRGTSYVAVSDSTRRELIGLGVDASRITIIHNGTDAVADDDVARSAAPRIIVLARLVPQKRIELALEAVATLRHRFPGLRLDVVGSGWWEPHLREHAAALAVDDLVTFHGHVSDSEKHRLLARAWVHAMPSLKEGWGLVVVEAGVHGTPTVAFREAGGPADSIRHDVTGLLVDDAGTSRGRLAFAEALAAVLSEENRRKRLSNEVRTWVSRFRWEDCIQSWENVLLAEAGQ